MLVSRDSTSPRKPRGEPWDDQPPIGHNQDFVNRPQEPCQSKRDIRSATRTPQGPCRAFSSKFLVRESGTAIQPLQKPLLSEAVPSTASHRHNFAEIALPFE
ncbi:hypothetical protein PG985_000492 [Apiospora marii]|uniref:Uncharacterized protein n=1 Tax=Apiospora marii TaxID=335849 RepID=A0ABR1R2B3_9PEZI